MDKDKPEVSNPFEILPAKEAASEADPFVHKIRDGVICKTDTKGGAKPRQRGRHEIVVDASEGFVPLWEKGTIMRWRFQPRSFSQFKNPTAARTAVRKLFTEAVAAWGDSAPVKFVETSNVWDFEIVVNKADDCDGSGCVLAMAFFPDGGRHKMVIYPKMFQQVHAEQVETLVHEIGHVFGLRHFFANITEKVWASEIFGTHDPFSIMNYGGKSVLTAADKADLKKLYEMVWSDELKLINGTPINLVKPFHALR